MDREPLRSARLGLIPYDEATALQLRLAAARHDGDVADTLLLLEHPPVLTKGRRTDPRELGMGEDWYRMQGIEVAEADRGGRVTYHGPGQLVAYPIVDLTALGEGGRARRPRLGRAARAGDDRGAPRARRPRSGLRWADRCLDGRAAADPGRRAGSAGRRGGRRRSGARRRTGRGPQDRLDRHPRQPWNLDPRPRDQRQQRPPALRLGRPLRDRGGPDDVGGRRARRRAGLRGVHRPPSRRRSRASSAVRSSRSTPPPSPPRSASRRPAAQARPRRGRARSTGSSP